MRTSSLNATALVLARELTDDGNRTDLIDASAAFGFDRAELEAELDAAAPWLGELIGYRRDNEIYAEIRQRITRAGPTPKSMALAQVLDLFAQQSHVLAATPAPDGPPPVPKWLTEALLYVVRLPASRVERMNFDEAEKAWTDHISGSGT